MRKWVLYEDAKKQLRRSGLEELLAKRNRERMASLHITSYGQWIEDRAMDMFARLEDAGAAPRFLNEQRRIADTLLYGKGQWLTEDSERREQLSLFVNYSAAAAQAAHAAVLLPMLASCLLEPEELDHSLWGFPNGPAMYGAIAIHLDEKERLRKSPSYQSKQDGNTFCTEIGADHNGDLRIYRYDLTQRPMIAPTGDPVGFRPLADDEKWVVAPYHSTEPTLLAALIAFAEHDGIHAQISTREGRLRLVEETSGLKQYVGPYGDAGYESSSLRGILGISLERPLRRVDAQGNVEGDGGLGLTTASHTYYLPAVTPDGWFALVYQNTDRSSSYVALTVPSGEIDAFARTLLAQTASGLGRTHLKTMHGILTYRGSDEERENLTRLRQQRS